MISSCCAEHAWYLFVVQFVHITGRVLPPALHCLSGGWVLCVGASYSKYQTLRWKFCLLWWGFSIGIIMVTDAAVVAVVDVVVAEGLRNTVALMISSCHHVSCNCMLGDHVAPIVMQSHGEQCWPIMWHQLSCNRMLGNVGQSCGTNCHAIACWAMLGNHVAPIVMQSHVGQCWAIVRQAGSLPTQIPTQ
jgi:hypothetical protein